MAWSVQEWNQRRATGLPAWEAAQKQADTDYWTRTRDNAFFTANPKLQEQATKSLQANSMFDPRSLIPANYNPFGAGFKNPDPTGPAYQGAPPPQSAPPQNAMIPAPQQAPAPNPWMPQSNPLSMPTGNTAPTGGNNMTGLQPGPQMMEQNYAPTPTPSTLPPGFNLRTGSTDPIDPAEQIRLVYGDNYFPGGNPGFEGIMNAAQFNALTPDQQGSYREALYLANQRRLGQGPQPGQLPIPGLPGDPYGVQEPGSQNTVGPGGVWQGTPGTGVPGYQPTPQTPTTPTTPAPTGGGIPPAGNVPPGGTPGAYPGGRGNYMGYGPNGGENRVDPNYLPENYNYEDTPEFKYQLEQALRGANRRLLAMGRSDSTGGINALNNLESNLRGAEVDKAYGRAVQNNMTNYGRMFDANQVNYGRTRGEDQTGWDRAAYLDNVGFRNQGRDFSQNYALADMGLRATEKGVDAGGNAGRSLSVLLSENGANQAALALDSGDISAEMIDRLLKSGFGFNEIEKLFGKRRGVTVPSSVNVHGAPLSGTGALPSLPGGQVPTWLDNPNTIPNPGAYEYDFFAD